LHPEGESWPALHPEIRIKFGTISLQEKAEGASSAAVFGGKKMILCAMDDKKCFPL
jgi:hypothetical protein